MCTVPIITRQSLCEPCDDGALASSFKSLSHAIYVKSLGIYFGHIWLLRLGRGSAPLSET
jgi:hypothetical protein